MKKKKSVVQILSPWHTLLRHFIPIYFSAYDWPFGIGYWNTYVTCIMGVAHKNLCVMSDFSQMRPSRSGFWLWMNSSRSDSLTWSDCWIWMQPLSR